MLGQKLTVTLTVAPDALAQVKKGLKGLFGRKKRERDAAAQSHSTSGPSSNKLPAAAAPAAGLAAAQDDPEETRTGKPSTG